ncbi:MAG: hypothetical protein KDD94_15405 [Calditrichaeota bacterium]|nr:hypothetical protein [Calditrichota bacterium]
MKLNDGFSLAESIVSLVLFSGILLPLIWYFMQLESNIVRMEEQIAIEREVYHLLNGRQLQLGDSLFIGNKSYSLNWQEDKEELFLEVYQAKNKVYEKHFIR